MGNEGFERVAGLLGILTLGPEAVDTVRQRREQREVIDLAAQRLESMNLDEAKQVADLVRQDPQTANGYVQQVYGGWNKMFEGLLAREALQRTGEVYERGLTTGPAARTQEQASARQLTVESLREGVPPPSPALLSELYTEPQQNPAVYGINPGIFTGESIVASMAPVRDVGVPDFTKLKLRKEAKDLSGMKIPTGYYLDDDGVVKPIPGTAAELTNQFIGVVGRARSQATKKGGKYTLKDYLKDNPEDRIIADAYLRTKLSQGGLGEALFELMRTGEEEGAPAAAAPPKETAGERGKALAERIRKKREGKE